MLYLELEGYGEQPDGDVGGGQVGDVEVGGLALQAPGDRQVGGEGIRNGEETGWWRHLSPNGEDDIYHLEVKTTYITKVLPATARREVRLGKGCSLL